MARARAEHWRELGSERAATLDDVKRRFLVRAALALERRSQPFREMVVARFDRARHRFARAALAAGSLPNRHTVPGRRARLLDALDRLPAPASTPRLVSLVVVTDRPLADVPRVASHVEVVVVLTSSDTEAPPGADQVIEHIGAETAAAAARRGAAAAGGDLICFLAPTSEPVGREWLGRLVDAIGDGVVAATPLLVHPDRPLQQATPHDLRTRELGVDIVASGAGLPATRARDAGRVADPEAGLIDVAAGSGACLLVERVAYEDAGGFSELDDLDAAAVELCWRLRARGGRVVAVPSAVVADGRPVRSRGDLAGVIDSSRPAWRAVIDHHGPQLLRSANGDAGATTSFVLSVAAPSAKMAPRWGDWHLAQALARSLVRLAHPARVHTADKADDPAGRSCDVRVVIRGREPVRRTAGQRHVLWVISHPETLDSSECDEADLVLVASSRFAAYLRSHTTTPVEVFLQATDDRRFRRLPPDPRHRHPVAVVAKTRNVLRPVVADAIAAGLRPAIYGTGWEDFVDPELVVTDYVANDELPIVYSSVGVLLNDHWSTMRSWGFVSNRLFDALACDTPVVSDDLPEVKELFGDTVLTYRDPPELRRQVDAALEGPVEARHRAGEGRRRVLEAHTFDHRARSLVDLLEHHGLISGRTVESAPR